MPITFRTLYRHELTQIWQIDRQEPITGIYTLVAGQLVLCPAQFHAPSWYPSQIEEDTPRFYRYFDQGATFLGAFEDDRLLGIAILKHDFFGNPPDQLQFYFLHVSYEARGRGIGKALFTRTVERAKALGARRLYISATPTEHTVQFYLRQGCTLMAEPDPELFAAEPEDIHFEYGI